MSRGQSQGEPSTASPQHSGAVLRSFVLPAELQLAALPWAVPRLARERAGVGGYLRL